MLISPHAELEDVTTLADLGKYMFEWATSVDLPVASAVIARFSGSRIKYTPLHNLDAKLDALTSTQRVRDRDPVMHRARDSAIPLVWDSNTYAGSGCGDIYEDLQASGVRSGVIAACHMPGGGRFALRLDGASPQQREPLRIAADVALLAAFVCDAAVRVLSEDDRKRLTSTGLTPRESELLRWTALGKTAWEIAVIVGLSRSTVAKHLDSAARKLGCTSRREAALLAQHSGLIQLQ